MKKMKIDKAEVLTGSGLLRKKNKKDTYEWIAANYKIGNK